MTAPILQAVHHATGCTPDEILSRAKTRGTCLPRYIALLLLRDARPFQSENELGKPLGLAGHGTTRYALRKARELLTQDDAFRRAYEQSKAILEAATLQPQGIDEL